MTRTKQQELEQAQNLHLIRDERDLELENSCLLYTSPQERVTVG